MEPFTVILILAASGLILVIGVLILGVKLSVAKDRFNNLCKYLDSIIVEHDELKYRVDELEEVKELTDQLHGRIFELERTVDIKLESIELGRA